MDNDRAFYSVDKQTMAYMVACKDHIEVDHLMLAAVKGVCTGHIEADRSMREVLECDDNHFLAVGSCLVVKKLNESAANYK